MATDMPSVGDQKEKNAQNDGMPEEVDATFERECSKVVKKAKDFLVRKVHRKGKRKEMTEDDMQRDLKVLKELDLPSLVKAVGSIRQGEKPCISRDHERAHQLSFVLLNSGPVKRFLEDYEKKIKRLTRRKERKRKRDEKRENDKNSRKQQKRQGRDRDRDTNSKPDEKKKGKTKLSLNLKGIKVGAKLKGIVDGAESFGVFVKFLHQGNIISGLCHISNLANKFVKDPSKEFPIGAWVNAEVLKLDHRNERLSVSFKGLNNSKEGLKRAKLDIGEIQKTARQSQESKFISSLGGGAVYDESDPEKLKSRAVLALLNKVKHMQSGKTKGKNRAGQRARKKFYEALYGGGDELDSKDGGDEEGDDGNVNPQKRQKGKVAHTGARAQKARKAPKVSAQVTSKHSQKSKITANNSQKAIDHRKGHVQADEEDLASLHPSWAAKRKAKAVKFTGTRIKFED